MTAHRGVLSNCLEELAALLTFPSLGGGQVLENERQQEKLQGYEV
jgi:hypothetical protein